MNYYLDADTFIKLWTGQKHNILFIPVVIWGKNMGLSTMIENKLFLAVSLLRTSISILCSDKRG